MINPYINPEDFEDSCPDTNYAELDYTCIVDLDKYFSTINTQLTDHINNPTLSLNLRKDLDEIYTQLQQVLKETLGSRVQNLHDYFSILDSNEYKDYLVRMGKINHAEDMRMEF